MDLDPSTLDLRDRAASAEPPTTRPNPFDDTDISSRKRRRTSTSGSPAKSVDIVNPLPDSPSSGTLDGDVPVSDNTELTKLDTEPITPQTPEHLCSSEAPPVDAPSSMVTINLRNVALGENMSSPISPSGEPKESKASASRDDVKSSVEDLEVDMVQLPEDTPQSSSSHSESPPIELITVPSDDDIAFEGEGGNVSIIEQDQPLVDPLQNFPYQETGEALLGTVQRLTAYLSDRKPCPSYERRVADWELQKEILMRVSWTDFTNGWSLISGTSISSIDKRLALHSPCTEISGLPFPRLPLRCLIEGMILVYLLFVLAH